MTEKIYIFDTTLRDGEQSPGASMNLDEKLQIAEVLDSMKVDIIEAGFPIASPGDFEAVSAISKVLKKSIPCGLARHSKKDIDRCYEALKHAPRFRIHTFISTSPLHMKHKLNKTPDQVYDSIKEHPCGPPPGLGLAANLGGRSPEPKKKHGACNCFKPTGRLYTLTF